MKLVSKEMVVDDATFQPHIRITVDMPIEAALDASVTVTREEFEDEYAPILGKQLLEYAKLPHKMPPITVFSIQVWNPGGDLIEDVMLRNHNKAVELHLEMKNKYSNCVIEFDRRTVL